MRHYPQLCSSRWPLKVTNACYDMGPDETSIVRLLAAAKLSAQTRKNYVIRVRAFLRRVGQNDSVDFAGYLEWVGVQVVG